MRRNEIQRILRWKPKARVLTSSVANQKQCLHLELLEHRCLLAVTPQVLNLNPVPVDLPFSSVDVEQLVTAGDQVFFIVNGSPDALWKTDGQRGGTSIVFNLIRQAPDLQELDNLTNVGGKLLFTAYDDVNGTELWKSDGTSSGTSIVRDLRPGILGSDAENFVAVGDTLFFTANDGTLGHELWKSDGTNDGTILVRDLMGGTQGSEVANLIPVGDTLFFTANDGNVGMELWKTDGTNNGTMLVRDISPGPSGSFLYSAYNSFAKLTNVNGTLFFRADDSTSGSELWRSDGTSAGTVLVQDILPGSIGSSPSNLVNVGGTVFFEANGGLWISDGSQGGTTLVRQTTPSGGRLNPRALTSVAGQLLFASGDIFTGTELWRSDGSSSGTVMVRDIQTGAASGLDYFGRSFSVVGQTLFFAANDGISGLELWKSDGTEAGTAIVSDLAPGNESGFDLNDEIIDFDDTVLFETDEYYTGTPLWTSDESGSDAFPVAGELSSFPRELTNVSGTLFFAANDGTHGSELWKSDGTSAGTTLVHDIRPGNFGSNPSDLVNVGGTVFFKANSGVNGDELWKSDGTSSGTTLVSDIRPGSGSSFLDFLVNVGGTLFFRAYDGVTGDELWKSDGTSNGTTLVRDIKPGSSWSAPSQLVNVGGTLFFTADDGVSGDELWKSDGTSTGTSLVSEIDPRSYGSGPGFLVNVGGILYFTANDRTNGRELWKSDGTSSGTSLVSDISPGSSYGSTLNSSPFGLVNVGGILYFTAEDGTNGRELWKSDGSSSGTSLVRDIWPGSYGSDVSTLVNVGSTLFFSARQDGTGDELWKSDGTNSGTSLVRDIGPGSSSSYPSNLVNVGGTLFFEANNGTNGVELWRSDGTSTGTSMVSDILPGSYGSYPSTLVNAGGTLFFSANDGLIRSELWILSPIEIDVEGNALSIRDGDVTPSLADDTDFGSATLSSELITKTFTILNTGIGTLNLSGSQPVTVEGAHAGDFIVTAQPVVTVGPGESTTFTLRFSPGAIGLRTANVLIASDDADEAQYNFAIKGLGTEPLLPDLGGSFFVVSPTAITPVGVATVTYEVENVGNEVSPSSTAQFFLSRDIAIEATDKLLGSVNVASLAVGANSGNQTVNLPIPDANDPIWQGNGTYYIGMMIDAAEVVVESDETNNSNLGFGLDLDSVQVSGLENNVKRDTIGLFDPNALAFALNTQNLPGSTDITVSLPDVFASWKPFAGDWNNDGTDDVGLYDPASGTFRLQGVADVTGFSPAGRNSTWLPIAGDWNGDGPDTVGLYDPATATFYLRNEDATTITPFAYTPDGQDETWLPIAGNWDGVGGDSIGLFDPVGLAGNGVFYLRDFNSAGDPSIPAILFGEGFLDTTIPVVGDWDGDGIDTIGVYDQRLSIFNLRNDNSPG
ncbi:MAG: choice-of-anchor D domain-containing protein, partial [Pirellulales bacterium]